MSSFVKYKIREVAKDFDMPAKSIVNMVTEHFEAPKSSAQVLSDDQLNLVFDLITKENQMLPAKRSSPRRQPRQSPRAIRRSPRMPQAISGRSRAEMASPGLRTRMVRITIRPGPSPSRLRRRTQAARMRSLRTSSPSARRSAGWWIPVV